MTRYLPDNDLLVLQVIRGAIAGDNIGTVIPSDLLDNLPFITVSTLADRPAHPKLGGRCRAVVQCWSDNRKTAADTAETVRIAINDAYEKQTVYAGGRISFAECISAPSLVPNSSLDGKPAQNLYRSQATYRLVVRSN